MRPPIAKPLPRFRYDLCKLRAKGLVEKLPRSRRYRILPQGYFDLPGLCEALRTRYAPIAGRLSPVSADATLPSQRRSQFDSLYQRVIDDLDALIHAIGLKQCDTCLKREQNPR